MHPETPQLIFFVLAFGLVLYFAMRVYQFFRKG